MRRKWSGWLILCFILVSPGFVFGQGQGTASIEGVVQDSSGAVIPGVPVMVKNTETNATRATQSDASGHYQVDLLPPGIYEATAIREGFANGKSGRVVLNVGTIRTADITLAVAGGQQVVEVTGADIPATEPERVEVASTIGERAIRDLPINGRRWENFVLQTPGVTPDGNYGLVSYRGISGLYNNNSVDGADNTQAFFSEARGRTRSPYSISQAAVKEFNVGLSNFSAEFGRAAGGTVNAVTKSGTNELHGEAFYFIRDQALMAQNPRAVALGQPKPDERRQQFGASLGGPVIKDKVFFFFNYDQQKRNFPAIIAPNVAFDSLPCTAPGCASTIAFLKTQTGEFPRTGSNLIFLPKVDWNISAKHSFSAAYNYSKWHSPNGIQTQSIHTYAQSANGSDDVRTDMLNLRLTSVLTASSVNEFRFQAGRDFEFQDPNAPGPGTSFTNGIYFGMPNFLPRQAYPNEKRFQFTDNYSFMKGKHSIKVGLDVNYVRELAINLYNGGGTYSYSSLNNLAMDCPADASGCVQQNTGATTGKHYSNFQQAFDARGVGGKLQFNSTDSNFYLQDNYRLRNDLTLYLGLRYEYQALPQPEAGNPAYPLTTKFNKDKKAWGPRFGFSWDVGGSHKTVVRGGYGLYYGRTSNSALFSTLTNNAVTFLSYYFTPSTSGAPVYPNVLSAPPSGSANTPTLNVFSSDYRRPIIYSSDLAVEREIFGGMTVSASYLFSRGQRLPQFRDINLPFPTGTVSYVLPDGSKTGSFPLYLGSRPDKAVGQVILSESIINTSYNAMVLAVSKRFSHGMQIHSNFTWSKSLDNGQTSQTFFSSYSNPFDTFNLANDKGLSSFDVPKRWITTFILSPNAKKLSENKMFATIFNDWQMSGIATLSDGKPITGTISGSLSSSIGTPNSSSTNGSGGSFRVPWLAPNSYRGTGQATLDFRLSRFIPIKEKARIQVVAEAFNIFNRVNYTSWQSVQYRVVSSAKTGSNATVTLGAPSGTPFLAPINVGNTLFGPREIQFAAKFIW